MSIPLFKDLYKPFKDFHTKNYDVGAAKFEVKGCVAEASVDSKRGSEALVKVPVYDNTIVKVRGTTNGNVEVTPEFKKKGLLIKDAMTFTKGTPVFLPSFEFLHERFSLSGEAFFDKEKVSPMITFATGFGPKNKYLIGGQAELVEGKLIPTIRATVRADELTSLGTHVNVAQKLLTLGILRKLSCGLLGIEMVSSFAADKVGLAVGLEKNLHRDPRTTLKGRIAYPTCEGQFAISHCLGNGFKLVMGLRSNLDLSMQYGFTLTYDVPV